MVQLAASQLDASAYGLLSGLATGGPKAISVAGGREGGHVGRGYPEGVEPLQLSRIHTV